VWTACNGEGELTYGRVDLAAVSRIDGAAPHMIVRAQRSLTINDGAVSAMPGGSTLVGTAFPRVPLAGVRMLRRA